MEKSNGLWNLQAVAPEVSGEGFPYAPENWPEQGDIWGWRTGRRVVANRSHFKDRYLYLPNRLIRALKEEKEKENAVDSGSSSIRSRQHIFASKLAVESYIKKYYPEADLDAFFASFSWKIPALPSSSTNGPFLLSLILNWIFQMFSLSLFNTRIYTFSLRGLHTFPFNFAIFYLWQGFFSNFLP